MKYKWTKESIILLILSLLILIGGLYYGHQSFIQPASESQASSTRILNDQKELLKRIENLEMSEQELTTELEMLNESLPITSDPSSWLNHIKELADKENLEVFLFNSVETTDESDTEDSIENVSTQSYQLEVEYNTIEELKQFIEEIYGLTQTTDVSSIYYEVGQSLKYRATIFLKTYNQITELEE